jgi:phosphoglycolate phosphatase
VDADVTLRPDQPDSPKSKQTGWPKGVVLWDIDGTLVTNRKKRRSLHGEIVRDYFGVVRSAVRETSGFTDYEILRAISPPEATEVEIKVLLDILDCRYAETFQAGDLDVLPGVLRALRLAEDLGWHNALQTGNTAQRAEVKLESVGLWSYFSERVNSFGGDSSDRSEVVRRAAGLVRPGIPILLIGDTPRDSEAAVSNGIPMLGVETGAFRQAALRGSGAYVVVTNLVAGATVFRNLLVSLTAVRLTKTESR